MATVTTNHEKYSRLALMLVRGGTKVTRALFEKCYKAMSPKNHIPFPWTIDEFLQANKEKILSSQTGRNKEWIFFPDASGTEIDKWDLLMFCFVLVDVCGVPAAIRMYVDQLKNMRNKLCHLSEPIVETVIYEINVLKIKLGFKRLLKEIGDQLLTEEISSILHAAEEGPLSLQDTINVMHQFYSMEGETREILSQNSEVLNEIMKKIREMEKKQDLILKNQVPIETETVNVPDTFIELLVKNCVSDKEEFISKLLVHLYKEATGSSTANNLCKEEYSKLMAALKDTIDRFTAQDRSIVDAEQKCVIFRIRCTSVASLLSLFDDYIAGDLNKELKSLEECIRDIRGCEDVTLEAVMFEEEVLKTLSKIVLSLEEMISRSYNMACQSSAGRQNSNISTITDVNLAERLSPTAEDDRRIHHTVRLTIRTDQDGKDQLKQSVKDGSFDSSINRLKDEIIDHYDLTKLSIEARVCDEESSSCEGAGQFLVNTKSNEFTNDYKEDTVNEDTGVSWKINMGAVSKEPEDKYKNVQKTVSRDSDVDKHASPGEIDKIENDNFSTNRGQVKKVQVGFANDPYKRRLYEKSLQNGVDADRHFRVNVLGLFSQGKTTLIKRLVGGNIESVNSTNGIDINRYSCKQSEDGHISFVEDTDDDSSLQRNLDSIVRSVGRNIGAKTKQKLVDETMGENDEENNITVHAPVKEILYKHIFDLIIHPLLEVTKKEETLDIWEFAGHFMVNATSTLFLSRDAIYLLVLDLSKDLESIICDDEEFPVETSDKNMEFYIKFWVNYIHYFCGTPNSSNPCIILVGTHKDKLLGDTMDKQVYIDRYFEEVRMLFECTDSIKHIHHKYFAVDNIAVEDSDIESLKKEIIELSRESANDVLVPAKWISLEEELLLRRSEKIITFDEIKKIDSRSDFPLGDDGQIKLFLLYHHSKGTLLFYDEEPVSNYVLLNPKYLIDAFKCIVTSEKIGIAPNVRPLWNRLVTEAILENDLIDFHWQMSVDQRFMKDRRILLSFLVKNNMLMEVFKFDEACQKCEALGCFMVPSLLKTRITTEELSDFLCGKQSTLIRIALLFDNSVVVPTMCHRLFVAALGKWPVASYHNHCLLFEDFACFRLDLYEVGIIQMNVKDRTIELQVLGLGHWTTKGDYFRRFVETVVNHEFRRFSEENLPKPYRLVFRCNEQSHGINGSMRLEELYDITCPDICNHVLPSRQAKNEWFLEDKISNDDIPKETLSDKQLSKVSLSIGDRWEILGIALGLSALQIDIMKEENQGAAMRRFKLLLQWRKQNCDTATLDVLVKVMKEHPEVRIDWDIIRNIIDELKMVMFHQ